MELELVYTQVLLLFDPGCTTSDFQHITARLVLMVSLVNDTQLITGSFGLTISFVSDGQKLHLNSSVSK